MRLIDADALIEHLKKDPLFTLVVPYGVTEVIEAFTTADVPEINVGKWIPVTERLPEKSGEYLVTYHPCYWDDVESEILVGIDTFRGKTTWAKRKYQRVTAWMPLPKPYEGSEHD